MYDRSNDTTGGIEGLVQLTDLIIDQIRKLAELHQQGILTDEEFSVRKTELLARF